ncbi:FeS cluster assembly protein sufB [Photobacterium damselae]|nr:FeS cluster assembly protein sufB [Photobacterium damselae]
MSIPELQPDIDHVLNHKRYKEGFYTDVVSDTFSKGINEEVIRAISAKRNEPDWMLEFRLNAFNYWLTMKEPHWLKAEYPKLDYQDYSYYSAPSCARCDNIDSSNTDQESANSEFLTQEVEEAFELLGVPVREGADIAVDAIFDSVSVATTYHEELKQLGIIFAPLVRRFNNILN